jgi:DnaK suppressor protein
MVDFDEARAELARERTKLVHQLAELGATETGELRSGLNLGEGFADAGAITAERTELLGLADALAKQVTEIDEAVAAIEAGTYGVCSSCGQDIPAARLEARPSSTLCVSCKSKR